MIIGNKVTLRSISRDDLSRLWQFNNDLDVEVAGGGDPPVPQSLERLYAEFDQDTSRGGRDGTRFAIEVAGELVGQCALFNFNAAARTAELGITIGNKNYWGQGYGREAVNLLVAYAFRQHNLRKIWLQVHASNERAIRSYQACGFQEEGRLRAHVWSSGAYDDLVMMAVFAKDHEAFA